MQTAGAKEKRGMPPSCSARYVSMIACAAACMITRPAPLSGQVTAAVGPVIGWYRPMGHFNPASVYSSTLPQTPGDLASLAWGATGQLAFPRRVGLRAIVSIANSTLPTVDTPRGPSPTTHARVTLAVVEGQYKISSARRRYDMWFGAGPALIQHGGQAYAPYGAPHSWGAAAAIDLVAHVRRQVGVMAAVTGVAYTFDMPMPPELRANPGSLEHGAQRDLLAHLGVQWRLSSR